MRHSRKDPMDGNFYHGIKIENRIPGIKLVKSIGMNKVREIKTSLISELTKLYNAYWKKDENLNEYDSDSDKSDDDEIENDIDHDALCGICMDNPVNFDLTTRFNDYPSCRHYDNNYCNSCVYKYINGQIEAKKFGFIKCPYPSCKNQFNNKFIREVVDTNTYTIYLTEKRNIQEELKCRANPLYAMKKYMLTMWDNLTMNFRSLHRRSNENLSRRCPSCSYIIEKDGGCMHMTCTKCRHEFHWCCGLSYYVEHTPTLCFISKFWFITMILTGIIFLLWPLLEVGAGLISSSFSYIGLLAISSSSTQELGIGDQFKDCILFMFNVPDMAYAFIILQFISNMYHYHHTTYGIPYGSFIHKAIIAIYNRKDFIEFILLMKVLYFPPSHVIAYAITCCYRHIFGAIVTVMNVNTNNSYLLACGTFIWSIFERLKSIVLHDNAIILYHIVLIQGVTFLHASYAKVIVALNIENMKKKVQNVVLTPSMEELTSRLLQTGRFVEYISNGNSKTVLNDIYTYWSLKYVVNNPLVTVLLTTSIEILSGGNVPTLPCLLLWEIVCFIRQFNSLSDCCKVLRSYLVKTCDNNYTLELIVPQEPVFIVSSSFAAILVFSVAESLLYSEIWFLNTTLIKLIVGFVCDPRNAVFLLLAISTYYYLNRVI